jgi:RNA polymerase sigma factor (sigma-70 family)
VKVAAPARRASRARRAAGEQADRPLVLVVDDDNSVRRALSALLRSVGLEVETFASAQEFLAFARPDRPCCLVCDMRLPGQSGLDLQESLTAQHADMAIIFITGYGTVHQSVRAMRAGALHFLEKPFEDQDFLDAVYQALLREQGRRRARDERSDIERRFAALTEREREVLHLVVAGLPNKKIAAQLGTSEKTVKVHRGHMMEKMHAASLAELVQLAGKAALSPPH